jgi:hypothetical protein
MKVSRDEAQARMPRSNSAWRAPLFARRRKSRLIQISDIQKTEPRARKVVAHG